MLYEQQLVRRKILYVHCKLPSHEIPVYVFVCSGILKPYTTKHVALPDSHVWSLIIKALSNSDHSTVQIIPISTNTNWTPRC